MKRSNYNPQKCASLCPTSRKVQFASKSQAKKAAKVISGQVGHSLYTYCCPHCEKWHITKAEQSPT